MKKFNLPTQAEKIFKGKALIVERPEGMSYEDYRVMRKLQTRALQMLFPKQHNNRIANWMRPKQKSKHMIEMLMLNTKGYLTDITDEAQENKRSLVSEPGWLKRQWNSVRNIFGRNSGGRSRA